MASASGALAFRDIVQRISCEPITRKDLLTSHPRLFLIYTDEEGQEPEFVAAAEKTRGTALGAFYERVVQLPLLPTQWLGKVGLPTGRLRDDPNSIRTRTTIDINLDTILEMLAYTLYQEFGRKLFVVPNTFLSKQPIMNRFTMGHALAVVWVGMGIGESLQIMCEVVPGYQDFSKAMTSEGEERLPLMEFIRKNHRPPLTLLTPTGSSVPLLGIMELLAVIRSLADTDGLGGHGENAGFIWVKEADTIVAARAVKIDPGCALRFAPEEEGEPCANRVINTVFKLGDPRYHLKSRRNIQIANNDPSVDIHWSSLSLEQREIFLSTLMNSLRYRNNEGVLKLLFYREGKFNRSPAEQISGEISNKLVKEMQDWLTLQEKLYSQDLKTFYTAHPEQLLRIQYIDTFGQLPLTVTSEMFPFRELFTECVLMLQDAEEEEQRTIRDIETITLEDLSIPARDLTSLKILLLGEPGIGKSTLCQKIIHDWASGKLWTDRYTAIYWLPMHQCNRILEQESDPKRWLCQALARLVLKEESLESSIEAQLRDHPQDILILLDEYDKAIPEVADQINKLLQFPELNLLVTSCQAGTEHLYSMMDCLVENRGFADDQIELYIDRFFQRGHRIAANAASEKTALLSTLQANPDLFRLARIPLQLQTLCSLWEKGISIEEFISPQTDHYSTLVQEIFLWQCHQKKLGLNNYADKKYTPLHTALTIGNYDVLHWLIENFPQMLQLRPRGSIELGDEKTIFLLDVLSKKCPDTTELDLRKNKLTSHIGPHLNTYLRSTRGLQVLDLSYNNLGDSGLEAMISGLQAAPVLRTLNLKSSCLTSLGAATVALVLRQSTSIKEIDLTSTPIGDEGARVLAEAIQHNTFLERLILYDCKITAIGINALAEALRQRATPLFLSLIDNQLSDALKIELRNLPPHRVIT